MGLMGFDFKKRDLDVNRLQLARIIGTAIADAAPAHPRRRALSSSSVSSILLSHRDIRGTQDVAQYPYLDLGRSFHIVSFHPAQDLRLTSFPFARSN